jgi:hypothetical protein
LAGEGGGAALASGRTDDARGTGAEVSDVALGAGPSVLGALAPPHATESEIDETSKRGRFMSALVAPPPKLGNPSRGGLGASRVAQ